MSMLLAFEYLFHHFNTSKYLCVHIKLCHAFIFLIVLCSLYCQISSFYLSFFFLLFSRNYNPVERRVKVGKDRNLKSSLKKSKSLQTNIMNNSGSGNTLGPNRTSG
jgi:hypothetical protein